MAITLTGLDIIEYKPFLKKYSNYSNDNTIFNDYITSAITEVERQFNSYIDITSTFLDNNENYLVCFKQYTYYLYMQSVAIKQEKDSQEVEYLKEAKNDYNNLFNRFVTIFNNNLNSTDDPISNNINLIFG